MPAPVIQKVSQFQGSMFVVSVNTDVTVVQLLRSGNDDNYYYNKIYIAHKFKQAPVKGGTSFPPYLEEKKKKKEEAVLRTAFVPNHVYTQ